MKALDIASLPLKGTHLIEASAGTGKTFTLANLYLRLIVESELSVEKILVVTFTRAAVQELRTRLRAVIVEARAVLSAPEQAQGIVADLLRPHLSSDGLSERLEAAQLSMDQAAISTIHTFCGQLLSDNAFESGQLFDMEVVDRDRELQLQAVQQYWRQHYLQLDAADVQWIQQSIVSPENLLEEITPLLSANPPRLLPEADKESYLHAFEGLSERWQKLCNRWREEGVDIRALIDNSSDLSRSKIKAPTVQKAAEWLDKHCQREQLPTGFPDPIKVFRDSHLRGSVKKGKSAPSHVFFDLVDELWDLLEPVAAMRMSAELRLCADFVKHWLQQQKAKLRMMSYEDLLHYAAQALEGEDSEALAKRLRDKFPAALIDEFQDTDPRQYHIFSRLYAGQDELAWYMIGDPKQAIYSFRGADIYTYLEAVARTEQRHTLGTNWRSTTAMVEAVNALFQASADPFALQTGGAAQVAFNPVVASGRADQHGLKLRGREQTALQVALLDAADSKNGVMPKGVATPQAAKLTAALIAEQLRAGQTGELCLGDKPLLPANIAVLVRTNGQGKLINEALSALGIASVVTGNDSIFSTAEANNLRRLLQALARPTAERLLLRVLASDLCGFQPSELVYLQNHDADWQPHVDVFSRLSELLKRQGVLAALLSLLADYQTAARLRLQIGGERSMSNYLQLGELLQEAWQEHPDLDSLQAWLDRHCDAPKAAGDVAQLRLETDEKLVQIVTVHKSKGLEYPVVYLPFVWAARSAKSSDRVKCHNAQGNCIDLGSDKLDEHRELMQAEGLAEDVRLLYVALTRASAQCTVLWGNINQAEQTAMARLLGQHGQKVDASFSDTMRDWVSACEQAEIIQPVEAVPLQQAASDIKLAALDCKRPPRPSWQISSYSALVRHAHGHAELPDYDASDKSSPVGQEPPETDLNSIMFFPRGAQAGTFLHYLFEHADFTQSTGAALEKLVDDSLATHGYAATWRVAVLTMMQQVLEAPLLPVANLRLSQLSDADRLNEMGFHFPVPRLPCADLVQLLRQYGVLGESEQLSFETVQGYMTGFVDLIFRVDNRYYVLDYKSNHLGYQAQDYHPQALKAAMQEHRYDLQYLMYTVALHRYLTSRIANYNYETHMGGSFYLFLRGLRVDDASGPGIYYDKPDFALIDALDKLFSGQAEVRA